MTTDHTTAVQRFDDLPGADIKELFDGGTPDNGDLAALTDVIGQLRSFADSAVSAELIEFHAAEAASRFDELESARADVPTPTRRLVFGLRRRITAAGASLVMLLGATGMAWAADGAGPGDWNYGIDLALEAIGIGAGGAAERLDELQAQDFDHPQPSPSVNEATSSEGHLVEQSNGDGEATGVERALEAVNQRETGVAQSEEARARVVALLFYLNTEDHIQGGDIARIARGEGPGQTGLGKADEAPGRDKKPEAPGNPSGQSGNPPGQSGNPPGKSGNQPGRP